MILSLPLLMLGSKSTFLSTEFCVCRSRQYNMLGFWSFFRVNCLFLVDWLGGWSQWMWQVSCRRQGIVTQVPATDPNCKLNNLPWKFIKVIGETSSMLKELWGFFSGMHTSKTVLHWIRPFDSLILFRMLEAKRVPQSVSPLQLKQTYDLAPKTFWVLVLTLLPHLCKNSRPYLVQLPNYWSWTMSPPQNKLAFLAKSS